MPPPSPPTSTAPLAPPSYPTRRPLTAYDRGGAPVVHRQSPLPSPNLFLPLVMATTVLQQPPPLSWLRHDRLPPPPNDEATPPPPHYAVRPSATLHHRHPRPSSNDTTTPRCHHTQLPLGQPTSGSRLTRCVGAARLRPEPVAEETYQRKPKIQNGP
jgi:hypothetical protein